MKIDIIYADSRDKLLAKMLGYYHDHCYHLYIGPLSGVPEKYEYLVKETKEFVFIYKEDIP